MAMPNGSCASCARPLRVRRHLSKTIVFRPFAPRPNEGVTRLPLHNGGLRFVHPPYAPAHREYDKRAGRVEPILRAEIVGDLSWLTREARRALD